MGLNYAKQRVDREWGGHGLMMVGVAPSMATNPPDGVMALQAGRLGTRPAPRASPTTQGAPKAPIGTHPTPRPTPRGAENRRDADGNGRSTEAEIAAAGGG